MRARRVVELNEYPCAVVFSKDNVVRYSVWSPYFSRRLCIKKGDKLPSKSYARGAISDPDEWHELDAYWWLAEQLGAEDQPESVYEQTLVQENGFDGGLRDRVTTDHAARPRVRALSMVPSALSAVLVSQFGDVTGSFRRVAHRLRLLGVRKRTFGSVRKREP